MSISSLNDKYIYTIIDRSQVNEISAAGWKVAKDTLFRYPSLYSIPHYAFEDMESNYPEAVDDANYTLIRFKIDASIPENSNDKNVFFEMTEYNDNGKLKFIRGTKKPKNNQELEFDELYVVEYTAIYPITSYYEDERLTTSMEIYSSIENALNKVIEFTEYSDTEYDMCRNLKNEPGAYIYIFKVVKDKYEGEYKYTGEYVRVVSPERGKEVDEDGVKTINFENIIDNINLNDEILEINKNRYRPLKYTYLVNDDVVYKGTKKITENNLAV